jgi:hypothetical protein
VAYLAALHQERADALLEVLVGAGGCGEESEG